MQKNIITNKITPCCGLPFSVVYWWVSNLTLNSEADRQYLLTQISQNGVLSIDGWKVLVNSGTLETDASLTKAEFLAWFNCGKQPTCEQLKLIIEGYKLGVWVGDLNEISFVNVLGVLKITDTTPTAQGLYILYDIGTYTNLGGLVATTEKLNYAYFNGTTWSLIAVEIPNSVVLDEQIKEMLLSESYMPQSATYTDGIINSPFNIIWANGATGAITVTRNTDGLVTNISATHIKDSITKTITAVITRNTDGNATNITISII